VAGAITEPEVKRITETDDRSGDHPSVPGLGTWAANEDGVKDKLREWIGGTDPGDPASKFETGNLKRAVEGVRLELMSVSGRVYAVEWKGALLGTNRWAELTNGVGGVGAVLEIPDVAGATQRFYRVRVRLDD